MQTCMRLCEKQKASKAVRTKLVKPSSTTVKPLSCTACANSEYARSLSMRISWLQLERSKIKCSPNFKVAFTYTSRVKNIKNPSEDIELFNFSTIHKMFALCNVRNRLQIDSIEVFILCPVRMSIFS